MRFLYTPATATWPFEPSFIGAALVYDTIALPLVQEFSVVVPLEGEKTVFRVSPFESWMSISSPWYHKRDETGHDYRALLHADIVEDIAPTDLFRHSPEFPTHESLRIVSESLDSEYEGLGMVLFEEATTIIGPLSAPAAAVNLARSLLPASHEGSCAVSRANTWLSDLTTIKARGIRSRLVHDSIRHALPEVFLKRLNTKWPIRWKEVGEVFPRLVDFLFEVRERTQDGRRAWQSYIALISSIPWHEEAQVIDCLLDERDQAIQEAYQVYRGTLQSAVRRLGGSVRWAGLVANLLTGSWLSGAKALATLAPKPDPMDHLQKQALAFMLDVENECRSWSRELRSDP